jgi:hypothetical protein
MPREIWDFGSSRFGLVEDLQLILLLKMISTLYSRLFILDEKARSISPYLTGFLYNARISYVMARTRWDLGSIRFF